MLLKIFDLTAGKTPPKRERTREVFTFDFLRPGGRELIAFLLDDKPAVREHRGARQSSEGRCDRAA